MGLCLTVGILADMSEHDPEAVDLFQTEFQQMNVTLKDHGIAQHAEPTEMPVWSNGGYPYSMLHSLRAVAATAWQGKLIPRDRMLNSKDQKHVKKLNNLVEKALFAPKRSMIATLLSTGPQPDAMPPFAHLCYHSDAEGYYLPIEFSDPILHQGEMAVGSVQKLESELLVLKAMLEIPDDLDPADPHLLDLVGGSRKPDRTVLWQCQAIATFACLDHLAACDHALKYNAAISYG